MLRACELQDTEATLLVARLYDKGVDGSLYIVSYFKRSSNYYFSFREPDWKKAAEYYEKYIHIRETQTNNIDEADPDNAVQNEVSFEDQYDIVARLATLYKTGDHNLECSYQRAGQKNLFES